MKVILFITLYFYLATGAIIGVRLSKHLKKWWQKALLIIMHTFIWLATIPADYIVKSVESNMKGE